MVGRTSRWPFVFGAMLLTVATACAPAAGSGGSARPVSVEGSSAPKTLTVALQREESPGAVAHDGLVAKNQDNEYVPKLAVEQISFQKGTWRVNPDGTMETTWRIPANVRWHDGAPLTSADLAFAYTVRSHPDVLYTQASQLRSISGVATPDSVTFVVGWSRVEVKADQAIGLSPLPKHLLEDVFATEKATILDHRHLTTELVGNGPYRLVNWESGVQQEFVRFEEYYRGRPPLDRLVLRFIADPTAMVANILAGAVDLVVPPGVDVDGALEVQRRWEGTGNRVLIRGGEDFNGAYAVQVKPEYARPRAGWLNRDVREALYRAIDRQAMADALTAGLSPIADSWISPTHPLRRELESAIPQYPYDPRRAQELLTSAGWMRGTDGILVHGPSGERFITEVAGPQRAIIAKQGPLMADQWRALGIEAETYLIPPSLDSDPGHEASRPGAILGTIAATRYLFENQLHSREVRTEANRWRGRNKGGWSHPAADDLFDRLAGAIDPQERVTFHRQLVAIAMGELGTMPYFWDVYPALALASVQGPIYPAKSGVFWNVFEWGKK